MVYFIQMNDPPIAVKIGYSQSEKTLKSRISSLQTGSPFKLSVMHVIEDASVESERSLHAKFNSLRLCGEWFSPGESLLSYINSEPSFVIVKYLSKPVSWICDRFQVSEAVVKGWIKHGLIDQFEIRRPFKESLVDSICLAHFLESRTTVPAGFDSDHRLLINHGLI